MRTLKGLAALCLILLSPLSSSAEDSSLQTYGEVYTGPKNEHVEIAYFRGGKSALVRIGFVNHPLDGKVLKATLSDRGERDQDFVAPVGGKPLVLLTRRFVLDVETMTLLLPNYASGPVVVTFDKDADKQFQPTALLADYEKSAGTVKAP